MIKSIIRPFIFTIISLRVATYVINSLSFGDSPVKSFSLVVLGLTLLNYFIKPVLAVVSMPRKGIGFLFINFVLTFIILHVMTIFLPSFSIVETEISDLIVFGFVLPSKSLTKLWSGIFSALLISLIFVFFDWLCDR